MGLFSRLSDEDQLAKFDAKGRKAAALAKVSTDGAEVVLMVRVPDKGNGIALIFEDRIEVHDNLRTHRWSERLPWSSVHGTSQEIEGGFVQVTLDTSGSPLVINTSALGAREIINRAHR